MRNNPRKRSGPSLLQVLSGLLALGFTINSAHADTFTSADCISLASPEWTPQEIWVWEKLCAREVADLDAREGNTDSPFTWASEGRFLTSRFITSVILDEPYATAMKNSLIRVYGAWYREPLIFDGARVTNFLALERSRFDGPVSFLGADIDARVELTENWFRDEFYLFNSTLSKDLILVASRFDGPVTLANNIGEMSIVMQDSEFNGYVNLSGSRLNEVVVGTQGNEPVWNEGARFSLRGTFLNILLDSKDSWKGLEGKLDLQGLTYQRFTGIADSLDADTGAESSSERPVEDLIEWLEMQEDRDGTFIPQPYQQLASALYDLGQNSKADQILYAMNEYWRLHPTTSFSDRAWLTIKKFVIGYGYQVWRTVLWLLLLISAGALALRLSRQSGSKSLAQCLLYSLDQAIPLVSLQPVHEDIARHHSVRLQGYFLTHQVISLILLSFLGAGLAGAIG